MHQLRGNRSVARSIHGSYVQLRASIVGRLVMRRNRLIERFPEVQIQLVTNH